MARSKQGQRRPPPNVPKPKQNMRVKRSRFTGLLLSNGGPTAFRNAGGSPYRRKPSLPKFSFLGDGK